MKRKITQIYWKIQKNQGIDLRDQLSAILSLDMPQSLRYFALNKKSLNGRIVTFRIMIYMMTTTFDGYIKLLYLPSVLLLVICRDKISDSFNFVDYAG